MTPGGMDDDFVVGPLFRGDSGLRLKYFVLNPTKQDPYGKASRVAMLAYADSIEDTNVDLARDLRAWVGEM